MSGRSNYRKTERRRGPPRPLIDRLHELNRKHGRTNKKPIRLFFRLPPEIERLVHLGDHQNLLFDVAVTEQGIQGYANVIEEGLHGIAAFVAIFTGRFKGEATVPVSVIGGAVDDERFLTIKNSSVCVGESNGQTEGAVAQERPA